MNQKTRDRLFIILIIAVIGFMTFTCWYLVTNKSAFLENPFLYGSQKMGNVTCSCIQFKNGEYLHFGFNDTEFYSGK